jgi:S1-C subfamily serine protease
VTTRRGAEVGATPVHFDPRNDVAVLQVDGLVEPPLPLAVTQAPEARAAVLGYPEDGPFTVTPARLGRTGEVVSEDAYGRGPVTRKMVSFRGDVRRGHSGGPAVDVGGSVLTTVFAASVGGGADGGLGIPDGIVERALAEADRPVDTGPCVT